MKRIFLRLVSLLLLFCLMLSLASCIRMSEAKEMATEVFLCLSEERYGDAAALFHPSYGITSADMESLAGVLADSYGADVTKGIVIKRTTNHSVSAYETNVDGSRYEMEMVVAIGDRTLDALIVIVRNDAGYGVVRLSFEE